MLSKEERRKRNIEMVVTALQELDDDEGVNLKDITKYVASHKRTQQHKVRRTVMTTILKGVRFGAIEKIGRGTYKLSGQFLNLSQRSAKPVKKKPKVYKKKKPQPIPQRPKRDRSESGEDDKNYYGDDDDGYGDDQDGNQSYYS